MQLKKITNNHTVKARRQKGGVLCFVLFVYFSCLSFCESHLIYVSARQVNMLIKHSGGSLKKMKLHLGRFDLIWKMFCWCLYE